ncbi:MAG TPA: hypothetical protein DCP28_10595, partial [Cytophagales bacterium]|nr:hypothetical protein [Cytophagales bacterium]
PTLPGATVLAFGPDHVLFVGDSKSGTVHAIATEATELSEPVPFNFMDLDGKIGEALGLAPRDLIIHDLKVHPVSQEAYVAVQKGHEPGAPSVIAIVSPTSPDIRFLDPAQADHSEVTIANPPAADLTFWRDVPASTLTITDMDYYDGHLYVAGLTNGEFASTLRKIAYPFDGSQSSVGGIEIYHAIHLQQETRAPIRTMLIEELNGVPTLIASYTCTPLVTIPLADIEAGKKIVGTTIAELGYGNTPIDMIAYMTEGQDGSFNRMLLVTQKHRSGSLIPMQAVAEAAQGEGMLLGMGPISGAPEGIENSPMPMASIMHLDDQNPMMVTTLKRNLDTGSADLVSELKGPYLRLSEFVSEYDFPDYRYGENQAFTKQFHDMIKPMEGYPELTSSSMGR